jgi:hypothetical protein
VRKAPETVKSDLAASRRRLYDRLYDVADREALSDGEEEALNRHADALEEEWEDEDGKIDEGSEGSSYTPGGDGSNAGDEATTSKHQNKASVGSGKKSTSMKRSTSTVTKSASQGNPLDKGHSGGTPTVPVDSDTKNLPPWALALGVTFRKSRIPVPEMCEIFAGRYNAEKSGKSIDAVVADLAKNVRLLPPSVLHADVTRRLGFMGREGGSSSMRTGS